MFKTSVVYRENYNSNADVVVNQGGTSSSKTYSIIQVLFTLAVQTPGTEITVAGQDIPNLKAGALRDAINIYNNSPDLQKLLSSYNKSERIFTFKNRSFIEFNSYDDEQDAKSGKRDYLFVNEANGVPESVYLQLALRTRKRIFIDYNPSSEFWVHNELIGKPGVQLIISDHRHNPFLTQAIRDKIEALKQKDEELWKVYARGLTGKITGLVFRNWNIVEQIPPDAKLIARGLDFGFTNDPTAVVEVFMQDGELWVRELIYERELTNNDIAAKLKRFLVPTTDPLIADSAEPKSIEEIRRLGYGVLPAAKGPDSIQASIDILKRYKINITRSSVNLRKELNSYKWAVDKKGNSTNEPVGYDNHAIDALRYVALNKLNNRPSGRYVVFNV